MNPQDANGMVTLAAQQSVDTIVSKLQQLLESKGIKLFALIDHSGEAAEAGLHMPNTKLVIFGNPKAGTSLMLAAPSSALDLPMKILIWEDQEAKVWITYNSPEFLLNRHGLPSSLASNIAVVGQLAAQIAAA